MTEHREQPCRCCHKPDECHALGADTAQCCTCPEERYQDNHRLGSHPVKLLHTGETGIRAACDCGAETLVRSHSAALTWFDDHVATEQRLSQIKFVNKPVPLWRDLVFFAAGIGAGWMWFH